MIDDRSIKQLLVQVAHAIEAEAKDIAPKVTGDLMGDIQVFDDNIGNYEVSIGNTTLVRYARYVHKGTKPHAIRPKNKKALKTPYGVFKKVNHPGTTAQPYLTDALQNIIESGKLDRILDNFADELSDEIIETFKKTLSKNSTIRVG